MRWTEELRSEMWPHLAALARTALEKNPDDRRYRSAYANAVERSGRLDEAANVRSAARTTIDEGPHLPFHEFADRRAQHLLETGCASELIALCRQHLAREPAHTHATYYLVMALGLSGDARQTAPILDLDRDVSVRTLPGANGDWLTDVAQDILSAADALGRDPAGKATRRGLQSPSLSQSPSKPIARLLSAIRAAIGEHVAVVRERGDHFARFIPECARLSAWAVVTGSDGYQAPHRHPRGRMSGVVYVQGIRRSADGPYLGPLVIGDPGIEYAGRAAPWGVREIEPVPGRIVLFPSYAPHATRPAGAPGTRIAVAFDVVSA